MQSKSKRHVNVSEEPGQLKWEMFESDKGRTEHDL